MDELMVLEDLHGVFLAMEAEALGYDDKALRRACRDGVIVRVRRGAYVFAETWAQADRDRRHLITADAVTRAAKCQAVLSHTTAALSHGADVWDLPLTDVHFTRRDRKAGRRAAGVVQHRGVLHADDVVSVNDRQCTSPVRTAIDITTITDVEHALVVVNSLLHLKLTSWERLAAAASRYEHVPGSLTTDTVVRLATGQCESPGESRTLYALWRQGVPRPELQCTIVDASGREVARVDFAWPELGVWLEFDGKEKYVKYLLPGETAADAVMREKKREALIRRLTGWTCVRISWADLSDPARIAWDVRAAMALRHRLRGA